MRTGGGRGGAGRVSAQTGAVCRVAGWREGEEEREASGGEKGGTAANSWWKGSAWRPRGAARDRRRGGMGRGRTRGVGDAVGKTRLSRLRTVHRIWSDPGRRFSRKRTRFVWRIRAISTLALPPLPV